MRPIRICHTALLRKRVSPDNLLDFCFLVFTVTIIIIPGLALLFESKAGSGTGQRAIHHSAPLEQTRRQPVRS